MTDNQKPIAEDLLRRLGVTEETIGYVRSSDSFHAALLVAEDMIDSAITSGSLEHLPRIDWWRNLFLIMGRHMVRTEEGWEVPFEQDADDPIEILDEVCRP